MLVNDSGQEQCLWSSTTLFGIPASPTINGLDQGTANTKALKLQCASQPQRAASPGKAGEQKRMSVSQVTGSPRGIVKIWVSHWTVLSRKWDDWTYISKN